MKYHLQHPDGTFSDLADYAEKPADRAQGVWVEGDPADRSKKHKSKSKEQEAAQEFIKLPLAEQLKPENLLPFLLGFYYTQIGMPEMLPLIVNAAQPSPEAQPAKDKIKEKLNGG